MRNIVKAVLIFFSISPLLLGCQKNSNSEKKSTTESTSEKEEREYNINPIYPLNKEVISLASDDITEMVNNYTFACSSSYVTTEDHYASKDVTISWDVKEEASYYLV